MPQTTKIGNMEAIFLIVTIMINHIILNLPQNLIDSSGSATIINVVFITLIALCIVYLICKLLNNFPNQDIIDISEFLGGKILKYFIGILFIIYLLFCVSVFLRSFCENLKIIFFPAVPVIYLIILFILSMILCSRLGIISIIRANLIFMPLVLFSILFIFLANFRNFELRNIFPVLGNGFNSTFLSGMSNLFAFSGIVLLYLIPSDLKDSKQFKRIAFSSVVLSGIWLLFSVATLLFLFPATITSKEVLPLYLASRFIEFGRFFQRLDSFLLFVWIISMTSYFAIVVSYILKILKKLTQFKYQNILIYAVCLLILLFSLIPQNYSQVFFLETTVYKYLVIGLTFVISLLILIFATLKFKKQIHPKKGENIVE